MSVLVSGSLGYDTILSYEGRFGDQLLACNMDHINLSFVTGDSVRNWGGCAGNVAYTLKMLGGEPVVIGALGTDGTDYLNRFDELGIEQAVIKLNDTYSAHAFITTDITGAQISSFTPGAMLRSHEAPLPKLTGLTLALIAPDSKQAMLTRAEQLARHSVPFVFAPGQTTALFSAQELQHLIRLSSYVVVSDYQLGLITRATGWQVTDIIRHTLACIVTHGEKGSSVTTQHEEIPVSACKARAIDPVGAGDAFRAGILYGLTHGFDWVKTLRLGSVMGAFNVECRGAQTYSVTREQICQRFSQAYGESLELV